LSLSSPGQPYRASTAQADADVKAKRPKPAKLATNLVLRRHVQAKLELNHSPEQISQRLRQDYPDDPEMHVSPETIYQSIYVQGRGGLRRELAKHLRTGRVRRAPRGRDGERRGRIPGMINISERPAEVADRAVPGHWEGDLIIGQDGASAIGTIVERKTGFVLLLHLPDNHGALAVQEQIVTKMSDLPEILRLTLTWDQGREMANHAQIAVATDLDIYFCDPHAPWQTAATRTPTVCSASTSPRAPTCPCTAPATSTTSPPNSTTGPANASTGAPPPKPSTNYSPNRSTRPVLH
jgi:IS30 family transposase